MHQQMALDAAGRGPAQALAEIQDLADMFRRRHDLAGERIDDVVEAQRDAMMLAIGPEGIDLGPVGIDHREHMRHLAGAVAGQFLDAADRQGRDGQGLHGAPPLRSPPRSALAPAIQPPGMTGCPA
ncbi:hypothetical protein D9M68_970080 [compost metagenome]